MQITKKSSTKVERILADALIKNKIPFEFRKIINKKEIDFLIKGKLVVELDGVHHLLKRKQRSDAVKNTELLAAGYSIYRISARQFRKDINKIINRIKEWQRQE